MSIKWIKDADTGELFPVQDDFEYDIPEHLKTAECNHIDYEKTTRTTIDELQSRLTAAQNEIAVIQQEREVPLQSDTESVNEIVSVDRFDFRKIVIPIIVIAVVIIFSVFACKMIITNDININTSYSAEYHEQEQQEEQDADDTEINPYINSILRLGALIVPIFGIKIAVGLVMRTVRDC